MDYKKICKKYLKGLSERTSEVIERRFGLRGGKRETLEGIGQSMNLTRERIRQIEAEGLNKIKPRIKESKDILGGFEKELESFGGVKKESDLLDILGEGKCQNQAFFILTNSSKFKRALEDNKFYTYWVISKEAEKKAKNTAKEVINGFKKERKPLSLAKLAPER